MHVHAGRLDGSLTAVRRDTGATVTLHRDYVESAVELGYATTAHRSQGITVDSGHTVVTQGCLTRELLYVSMTRGRRNNHAYVSENDPTDHEPLDLSLQPQWQEILSEVLAAEGAERTAHEVRDAEKSSADSLERLSAEYDYLAQIAAAEDLTTFIKARTPEIDEVLQQSSWWGAAVAAWRRATAASRPGAQRTVTAALETSGDAKDLAAVLHARLANFSSRMPAGDRAVVPEALHTNRPDLADMINQITQRIRQRAKQVASAAFTVDTGWKRKLVETLPPNVTATDTARTPRCQ